MSIEGIQDPKYSESTNVQNDDCEYRFANIKNVSYSLKLALVPGTIYSAIQTVQFDMKQGVVDKIFLDLHAHSITQIIVNSKNITEGYKYANHQLPLEKQYLQDLGNIIEITYENFYSNKGTGCHSYTDPEDNNQYLYTQFEAPYCSTFMPVFDQPNLKASLTLEVIMPQKWVISANEIERFQQKFDKKSSIKQEVDQFLLTRFVDNETLHHIQFYSTPRLSTYLFAFCAGPYFVKTRDPKTTATPLRLFCRKSYEKYITEEYANNWFDCCDHSVRFYTNYNNCHYPYSKMDSIICPEYNWGAMENAGCITYTEAYIFKTPPTKNKQIGVFNTICHEIAHQWFGNLVTMHWWDDLWLNEAFATFISMLCQYEFQDTKDQIWLDFMSTTEWGLRSDQRASTHPIATIAKTTEEAENLFDGISYGKGSAFLKVWYKYVGADVFREGIRMYFAKYAGGNTSLSDFVLAQDIAAKANGEIQKWAEVWLKTKGVINLKADYEIDSSNNIQSFKIIQGFEPNADQVYKKQKIDIAVFNNEGQQTNQEVTILDQEVTDLGDLFKNKQAKAIFINSGNHGYLKQTTDKRSLEFLMEIYLKIENPVDRACIVANINNEIRDGKFSAIKFIKFFYETLINEPLINILETNISCVVQFLNAYVSHEDYAKYSEKIFDLYQQKAEQISDSSATGYINHLFGGLLNCQANIQKAIKLLKAGKIGVHEVSKQHQQEILKQACSSDSVQEQDKNQLIKQIIGDSKESDAIATLQTCEILMSTGDKQQEYWQKIINPPKEMSQELYGNYCEGFSFNKDECKKYQPFVKSYFENLVKVYENHSSFVSRQFMYSLFPNMAGQPEDYSDDLQKILDENKNVNLQENGIAVVDVVKRRVQGIKMSKSSDWQI